MAEERESEKDQIRRKARAQARAAGKDWGSMSKDERRPYMRAARSGAKGLPGAPSSPGAANPWRDIAIKTATRDGRKWPDIPKEERRKYLATAREDWQRKQAQKRTQGS